MTSVWPGAYTVCVTEFQGNAAISGITVSSAWTAITPVGSGGDCSNGELCDDLLQCIQWVGASTDTCEIRPIDEAGDRNSPKAITMSFVEPFMLFGNTDQDCYAFALPAAAAFRFETSTVPSGDLVLDLWDAGGTRIGHVDDTGTGAREEMTQADLAAPTVAATYVLCVLEYFGYTTLGSTNVLYGDLL